MLESAAAAKTRPLHPVLLHGAAAPKDHLARCSEQHAAFHL
jgi:hypothetical protein